MKKIEMMVKKHIILTQTYLHWRLKTMYFEDENFSTYFNLYEKARNLEKLKKEDEALKIYLSILDKYTPKGHLIMNDLQ